MDAVMKVKAVEISTAFHALFADVFRVENSMVDRPDNLTT